MRNKGLSDRVRSLVTEKYVLPALRAGEIRFRIGVKDVLNDFSEKGDFPRFRTPVICQALLGDKLLTQNGLEIESVDGPPSKQSRSVVVHYRVVASGNVSEVGNFTPPVLETAEQRAFRLTERIRGLMKDEIAAHGGTEGFIRWVRSDEEEDAA
jgi:hypothetical protein